MALSATKRRAQEYPEPYEVQPRSGHHHSSFIVLHGRGSNGLNFGSVLLETTIPDFRTLQDAFPDAKFIFPTASMRRATIWGRTPIHQWFDNWSLDNPTHREELMTDGLRESCRQIHGLLQREIEVVGRQNVVLWGLSQGMAMTMISLLLWRGERFAAAVGMCGWLPLMGKMESEVQNNNREMGENDDLFGEDDADTPGKKDNDESVELSGYHKAARWLREELELPEEPTSASSHPLEIPVFLSHGTEDEKVPTALGEQAANFLRLVEFDVESPLYQKLGHWYSPEMLRDIVLFLDKVGIQSVKASSEDAREGPG